MNGIGAHEVVIETPQHQTTLAQLRKIDRRRVVGLPRPDAGPEKRQTLPLRADFQESWGRRGRFGGAPHSQLIALPIVRAACAKKVDNCWHYYDEKRRCISATSSGRSAHR